jgi:iron complex transport system substrate-binding protein
MFSVIHKKNRLSNFIHRTSLFLSTLLFLISFTSCSSKKEIAQKSLVIVDDLGNSFIGETHPKRIISLAPNVTEMIYDLGLEKYLVGNTMYCNYPEEAKKVEKVGDMLSYNFERILQLKPDLIFIVVEGNTKDTYDKFKSLGLKLFVANPCNYAGIKKTYSDISKIFGVEDKAGTKIASWDSTVTAIKKSCKSFNKSAMYLVELHSLILAGKKSFIHEYMEFCGLNNIAGDSQLNYPIFNREEILTRNPDYIIYPDDGRASFEEIKSRFPEWKQLSAIKNRRVIFVNRDLYSRPGSRFVDALKDLFTRLRAE